MIREWCDSCDNEITNKTRKEINNIPCHMFSLKGKSGYQDSEGMPSSRRCDGVVLCSNCWNRGWSAFLNQLNLPKHNHITWK